MTEGGGGGGGGGGGEYAELHCHSNFSFLDGASHPEDLAIEASKLGIVALALTDHNGLYGAVRFAQAARPLGLLTVFGAEVSLGLTRPQAGLADPEGKHLVILARGPQGYRSLSKAIADAQLAGGKKGAPDFTLEKLSSSANENWLILTGCRKGSVASALIDNGPHAAARALDELIDAFGREHVVVELWDHNNPMDSVRNDHLAQLAVSRGVDLVATGNVHYALPSKYPLATVLAGIRAHRSLEEINGWLPAAPNAYLRSFDEMTRRFSRYPGVVSRAGELGRMCAFDLALIAPQLPEFAVPDGHSEMSFLRELTLRGAISRYGPKEASKNADAWTQIEYELSVIDALGFPGYFLVVWDIVEFCRRQNIFCQGRGSAANSAVCYALGITNVDAVGLGLLFERFLSSERDGPPDIDVDIESSRREEVIQYIYKRYGRLHAAQVANVITYRPRSAIRDVAKVLGYSSHEAKLWSHEIRRSRRTSYGAKDGAKDRAKDRAKTEGGLPDMVREMAMELDDFPRHLGIHSGGMVICDRPVVEVCPVEWATKPGRTVLQWDKQDCAASGIVKFDLLGLGMLEALHRTIDLIAEYAGIEIDLASLPQETPVYDMLAKGDTVGIFQVESRAQMSTLPRLKPKCFYDIVIEVALIRPGPIQGDSVHPYLRRRNGQELITYLHPLLESSLKKTLGIPLFQEQLMQMAIDVAGFSPAESDQLRQAMSSKRSLERMESLRIRFYAGMENRGISGSVADSIWDKITAFANFGFPESHAASFAHLVYSSAWLKLHYPAAFCAGLLNSQPMGFWAPRTLISDIRRHGVQVLRPDINSSRANASLEDTSTPGWPAIRLGLTSIRSITLDQATAIHDGHPYQTLEELVRRVPLNKTQMEMLSSSGALASIDGGNRRQSIWEAGALSRYRPNQLHGIIEGVKAPPLPVMSEQDLIVSDLDATGVSVDASPLDLARTELNSIGVVRAVELIHIPAKSHVRVAGIVTHRQRPETANGITFMGLEDETGLINVTCSIGFWIRYGQVAQTASAVIVYGILESNDGIHNIVAERIEALKLPLELQARNFC